MPSTSISVKRAVKTYRATGPRGFYGPRATRGAAVLIDAVVVEAEELLAEGASEAEVAEKLALKPNTLHKAIRAGRVRSPLKKPPTGATIIAGPSLAPANADGAAIEGPQQPAASTKSEH